MKTEFCRLLTNKKQNYPFANALNRLNILAHLWISATVCTVNILIEIRFSSRTACLHAPISLAGTSLGANFGLAAALVASNLAGYQHLGSITGKSQHYGSSRNGLSEANHLATVGCQSEAMVRRNCHALGLRLEKCVAVGGAYSD